MREIRQVIVHCADTFAGMDIGFQEIDAWHKARRFKSPTGVHCGYHYIIRRNGEIEKGRPPQEIGAHAKGHNRYSLGICLVGGKANDGSPEFNFTHQQMDTLYRLLVALNVEYPEVEVIGHRDVSDKACPSFDLKAWWESPNVRYG